MSVQVLSRFLHGFFGVQGCFQGFFNNFSMFKVLSQIMVFKGFQNRKKTLNRQENLGPKLLANMSLQPFVIFLTYIRLSFIFPKGAPEFSWKINSSWYYV